MTARMWRKEARQSAHRGVHQLDRTPEARGRDLSECDPQGLEGEREMGRVEIGGRNDRAGSGGRGIVAGPIELELDSTARMLERIGESREDRSPRAEREGILQTAR